jgi:hypothetical protein
MRKCINDGKVPVRFVLKAWPMNRGLVGVRIQALNDKRYDCIAAQTGDHIQRVRRVRASTTPLPLEGNPIFFPAREAPPLIICGRVERVFGEKRLFAGWLQYDPCRVQGAAAP